MLLFRTKSDLRAILGRFLSCLCEPVSCRSNSFGCIYRPGELLDIFLFNFGKLYIPLTYCMIVMFYSYFNNHPTWITVCLEYRLKGRSHWSGTLTAKTQRAYRLSGVFAPVFTTLSVWSTVDIGVFYSKFLAALMILKLTSFVQPFYMVGYSSFCQFLASWIHHCECTF